MDRTQADEIATAELRYRLRDASSTPGRGDRARRGAGDEGPEAHGSLEPIDLNKIVRAVSCCAGVCRCRRDAHRDAHDQRPLRRGLDLRLDRLPIQTAASITAEEPQYSAESMACRPTSTRRSRTRRSTPSASRSRSATTRPDQRPHGAVRLRQRAEAQRHDRQREQRPSSRGLRTVYDRYLLKHPHDRHVIETLQYFFMRVACGLRSPRRGARLLPPDLHLRYLPSPRPCSIPHRTSSHPATCWTAPGRPGVDLQPLPGHRAPLQVRGRHRGRLPPVRSRGLHPGHQRRAQRHRPVAQDPRRPRRSGHQGGRRKGAACVYPRAGTRTSRSSSSCATTPVTSTADPQPQPRELDQ